MIWLRSGVFKELIRVGCAEKRLFLSSSQTSSFIGLYFRVPESKTEGKGNRERPPAK